MTHHGSPETFYSDNGTDFLGGSNLLRTQMQDIDENFAVTFMNRKTSYLFNPPSAAHLGKLRERTVHYEQTAMSVIADHPHHTSDEVSGTILLEAKAIIN